MTKRVLSRVALTVCLFAGAMMVNPAAANASAYTCASSHGWFGATCMYVNGTADWVEDTTIQHDHGYEPTNYCDGQVQAQYTVRNGATWYNYSGIRSGCAVTLSIKMTIRVYVYNPSYFYGQAKHDGSWSPGRPRVTVSA